ncbi:DUF11 domain-containing protein [Anaeromicropila herbilytica]|uniref:DUF11 domain-containing protein n=1 Tax=Anaeromicropila herbilytica TaxID=2785025 RepID=A0A7R7EPK9_9FIRM|nr:DUF11 domain-containing protein [Anaeromicropila herbilytica]BCN32446.1 hypothetical protein bsdtb5_37410 [Anaeromicropila herbilytica]
MSFVNRFNKQIYGGIVFTGNTLGVSKKEKELLAGTHHSIGAFITTDNNLSFQDFGFQTTNDYTKNRSNANLVLPDDIEILYAELIWGGRSKIIYDGAEYSVKDKIDDDIILWTPGMEEGHKITPSAETRFDRGFSLFENDLFYIRTAEVTELVKYQKSGVYGVGHVPSVLFAKDSYSFCGWTLAVIYETVEHLECRQVSLYVGGEIIEYKNKNISLIIDDIKIPKEYQNNAKLLLSASMGGYHTLGSEVYFGSENNRLRKKALLGSNNLAHHFFAGQINGMDGMLDKTGTLGDKNHKLKTSSMIYDATVGARVGWDITAIDVSDKVTGLDESLDLTFHTEGAGYLVNAVGLEFDAVNNKVTINKEVSSHFVNERDEIIVTLTISNEGSSCVRDVFVTDSIPDEMIVLEDGITVTNHKHGVSKHKNEINFMLGELTPIPCGGLSVVVSYRLKAKAQNSFHEYKTFATVHYYCQELEEEKYTTSNPITFIKENDGFYIQMEAKKSKENESENVNNSIVMKETIKNISKFPISNIVILHNLKGNAIYSPVVRINGKDERCDIASGVILESLESGHVCNLEYKIKIRKEEDGLIDYDTYKGSIHNQVEVSGIYKDAEEGYVARFKSQTSKELKQTIPRLEIDKISDKILIGKPGDRISFTLTVSNIGNVSVHNIIVTDKIQQGMSYVKNSTRINQGVAFHANPEKGIRIGDLDSEGSCVITYQAALLT